MIEKIQERALRFVLRDQASTYDVLLEKAGYESFRIHAVKLILVEMFNTFNWLSPEYLSDILEESDNPNCMKDKNKFIQPFKRTTMHGLRCGICYLCISKVVNPFQNSTRTTFETPKYPRRPRDQYTAQIVNTLELSAPHQNWGKKTLSNLVISLVKHQTTNTCTYVAAQNGRTVKQSHCETV